MMLSKIFKLTYKLTAKKHASTSRKWHKRHNNFAACGEKRCSARRRECFPNDNTNESHGSWRKKVCCKNEVSYIKARRTIQAWTMIRRDKSVSSDSLKSSMLKDLSFIYDPGSPEKTASVSSAAKLCDLPEMYMQLSSYHDVLFYGYGKLG